MKTTGNGQYQLHRSKGLTLVDRVDTTKLQNIEVSTSSEVINPRNTSPPLRLSQSQGWYLAIFLAVLALSVSYVSYTALHREYRINELENDLRELQRQIDALHEMKLLLERKNVQQDTRLDHLEDP
jgi:hypothetical protein